MQGLGRLLKDQSTLLGVLLATVVAVAVSVGFLRLAGLVVTGGVVLTAVIVATFLKGKLEGLTGDSYGAIVEVSEVAALLAIISIADLGRSWPW